MLVKLSFVTSAMFDRVWHMGLLYKLRAAGVTVNVLQWFKNHISDRKYRVVLPGISSASTAST